MAELKPTQPPKPPKKAPLLGSVSEAEAEAGAEAGADAGVEAAAAASDPDAYDSQGDSSVSTGSSESSESGEICDSDEEVLDTDSDPDYDCPPVDKQKRAQWYVAKAEATFKRRTERLEAHGCVLKQAAWALSQAFELKASDTALVKLKNAMRGAMDKDAKLTEAMGEAENDVIRRQRELREFEAERAKARSQPQPPSSRPRM